MFHYRIVLAIIFPSIFSFCFTLNALPVNKNIKNLFGHINTIAYNIVLQKAPQLLFYSKLPIESVSCDDILIIESEHISIFQDLMDEKKRVRRTLHKTNATPNSINLDLQHQVYKDNNIEYIRELPILVYGQIVLDFPRDDITVSGVDKEKRIVDQNDLGAKNIIVSVFNAIKEIIDESDCSTSEDLDFIHETIHLAMASRTQTFEVDTMTLIFDSFNSTHKEQSPPLLLLFS